LLRKEGVRIETIPAAGVHGVGWRTLPGNLWKLWRGFFAARRLLRGFRPHVIFSTGGYLSAPVVWAARLTSRRVGNRPKILLYVPDIEPGLALKSLARFSDQIALTVEASRPFFTNQTTLTVTGYPTRPELATWKADEARRIFALGKDLPVLLVMGGSKGARSINQAVLSALPELLDEMQVLQISGNSDWPIVENVRALLPPDKAARYRVYPYLHKEIGAALSIADLVISRAGASGLGEYPLFGLPAILVPYPYAWRYQRVNAQYLVDKGAAVILEDADLSQTLLPQVRTLIEDRERREKMRQAMYSQANPGAAYRIASLLYSLAGASS
jgi:UDP-N-acetylglucosamine--N-acetylmuramyl-(pentapeptide) pyrophosphoryl-undecaprenol N-acetylglucosamine transferase